MSDIQIGKPVPLPPSPSRPGKYRAVWDALPELEDGMAIPIVFQSKELAMAAANSLSASARRRGAKVNRIENTIYISRAAE